MCFFIQISTGKCWSKEKDNFVDFDVNNPTDDLYLINHNNNSKSQETDIRRLKDWISDNGMTLNGFLKTITLDHNIKNAFRWSKMKTVLNLYSVMHTPEVLYYDNDYAVQYHNKLLKYPFIVVPDFKKYAFDLAIKNIKETFDDCQDFNIKPPTLLLSKSISAQTQNSGPINYIWGMKSEKDAVIFILKGLLVIKPEDLLKVE